MHNHIYRCKTAFFLMLLSIAASCNVLEDRNECPCRLLFKAIDLPEGQHEPVIYLYEDDIMKERIEVPAGQLADGYVHETARKRDIVIYVWCDTTGYVFPSFSLNDTVIDGGYGNAFPALFRFSTSIDTRSEEQTVMIDFNKRFATLNVRILEVKDIESISIKGDYNGYRMDGSPVKSDFQVNAEIRHIDGYACFAERLPEQRNDRLILCIEYSDGTGSDIPLGKILESKGYNWDADDLMDISLTIEGAAVDIAIRKTDWAIGYNDNLTV